MTTSPSTVPPTVPTPSPSITPTLVPGTHLFRAPDGDRWFLAHADGSFTRLRGPGTALAALQAELHGGPAATAVSPDLRDGLHAGLRERGLLTGHGHPAPRRLRVRVLGGGPTAAAVRTLFTSVAEVDADPVGGDVALTPDATIDPDTDVDVLVTCASWLPDRLFRAIDDRVTATGTPWHRVHGDGTELAVGPFQLPGGVRYRDWRGRRLAASTTPEELAAFWHHLDTTPLLPPPATEPALAAVAAGVLVDDVLRWWATRHRPAGAVEQVVRRDPRGGVRIDHHPVLPLPVSPGAR